MPSKERQMGTAPSLPNHSSFENHLLFLETHRGSLSRDRDGIWLTGEDPDFTSWIPTSDTSPIPQGCRAVRLAPWSSVSWIGRLRAAEFEEAESLVYMRCTDPGRRLEARYSPKIIEATTEEQARMFADVQSSGFATGDPKTDAWWSSYFVKVALRNVSNEDQSFYVAILDGVPCGSTLAVRAAGVVGIYAVTTRSEFRRLGVSTALLNHAGREAADSGYQQIILQAMAGSYAQDLYTRLGFRKDYCLSVWRK